MYVTRQNEVRNDDVCYVSPWTAMLALIAIISLIHITDQQLLLQAIFLKH